MKNNDIFNVFGEEYFKNYKPDYSTQARNVPLYTQPHYTEDDFKNAQLVFGNDQIVGLSWDYSDRLQEWNYQKNEDAWTKAKESGCVARSADFYQVYLSEYYNKPIRLYAVMAGVNCSNGYPYAVFGHKED